MLWDLVFEVFVVLINECGVVVYEEVKLFIFFKILLGSFVIFFLQFEEV